MTDTAMEEIEAPSGFEDAPYASMRDGWGEMLRVLRSDRMLTVAASAELYRIIYTPGKGTEPWRNKVTPYLVEPMEMLTSRRFKAVILAAPAQCGKTEIGLNYVLHSAIVDPVDMLILQTSMAQARDFSRRRVDRMVRHSPELTKRKGPSRQDDNRLEKVWDNGSILSIGHPSINELSGRPIPRIFITDYDRMTMDVDGEGSPFDLAQKRATSFGSAGMVFCESSPGFEVIDASWQREAGSHASPPCEGVLAVFNRGDRRLWHWKCDHCQDYFEPLFDHLVWTEQEDDIATAESTQMSCPNCGGLHGPEDKYRLNLGGIWVPEGQHVETIDDEPVLVGEPRRSDIASYWLAGPAAAFQKWDGMVMKYRQAMEEFENNGSEEALKTTTNVDQCKPFLSMYKATQRSAAELESRAGPSEKKIVPDGVRTLVTSIDVNGSWFSVQVTGIGEHLERWVVDRYDIRISPNRTGDNGEPAVLNPGAYGEDWDALDPVVNARYKCEASADGATLWMENRITVCDSGGAKGVTERSYAYWRKQRKLGNAARFFLLKGDGRKVGQLIRKSYPDAHPNDTQASIAARIAKGEIPLYNVAVNMVKDVVDKDLQRPEPGPDYYHFPDWLPTTYYEELAAETKDPKKGWVNETRKRNESWDLCVYAHVAAHILSLHKVNWAAPPAWLTPPELNKNPMVRLEGDTPDEPAYRPRARGRRSLSKGIRR